MTCVVEFILSVFALVLWLFQFLLCLSEISTFVVFSYQFLFVPLTEFYISFATLFTNLLLKPRSIKSFIYDDTLTTTCRTYLTFRAILSIPLIQSDISQNFGASVRSTSALSKLYHQCLTVCSSQSWNELVQIPFSRFKYIVAGD